MSKVSMYIGGLLTLLGVVGYVIVAFSSVTALIPAFIGLPIAICGFLSDKQPDKRMVYMHVAVGLGALGLVASGYKLTGLGEFGSIRSITLWSMFILCFVLVGLYVQSFLKARMNRS